jgi:phosphoserine phosphatase RsbU/P
MKEDLEMARLVQRSMLPKNFLDARGLKIAARYRPSTAIGGDLYAVHANEDGQTIAVLMFDVAGHGVSSALYAAMAQALFTQKIRAGLTPKAVFEEVNRELTTASDEGKYLTAFLCVFDKVERTLTYASAANPSALLYRAGEKRIDTLESQGVFIGLFDQVNTLASYRENRVRIASGDKLLLYTDGLSETPQEGTGLFGPARIKGVFQQNGEGTPEQIAEALIKARDEFSNFRQSPDDVTFLVIEIE